MIAERVRRAWTTQGSRKALTPLLTASTPVIAVQPLANERISSHRPAVGSAADASTGGATRPPAETASIVPRISTARIVTMNRYVGSMNARPDSRTPRRLTKVMNARIARQSASVYGWRSGTAEIKAPTPAEMPTATTST